MSARTWETGVVDAADALVDERGVEGAVRELNQRRRSKDDELRARANEALAWVRRYHDGNREQEQA